MGYLGDIVAIMKDLKDAAQSGLLNDNTFNKIKASGRQYSSIAKRASEGTLQFPVIISSAMDIETAQNICKALERNYTTFAQIAFSHTPVDSYSKDWTGSTYIHKFHQNMGVKTGRDDLYNVLNNVMDSYNVYEDDDIIIYGATYESSTVKIQASNKAQLFDVLEHLRHDILNNKYIPKKEVIYNFHNPELNKKYNSLVTEADSSPDSLSTRDKFDREKFDYQRSYDKAKLDIEFTKVQNAEKRDRFSNRSIDLNKDMLKDNDVKKANELVATTLHLRVRLVNDKNEDVGVVDFMVGIKCIMHPVKSNDMVTNMVNACRNENKVFNFLRWTTGEISFLKDFILNVDEIKTDVTGQKHGASLWWSAMKRRKALSKVGNSVFTSNKILPNATIVISADEAEYIKSEFGYDLYNPIFFNKIMSAYFLLGFVIVDSAAQIAHFLFEDQSDFQTVTFSALEKSNVSDERKFKEMLKTINRM